MRPTLSIPFFHSPVLSLILLLLAIHRAQSGNNLAPLPIQTTLATNSSLPSASRIIAPPNQDANTDESKPQSVPTAISTFSSTASVSQGVAPIEKGAAIAQLTQVAIPASSSSPALGSVYNASEPAQVQPGSSTTIGKCIKRSTRFRRWVAFGLQARECVAPSDLSPETELVPDTSSAVADTQQAQSASVSQAEQSPQPKTPAVAGAQAIPLDTQQSQSSPAAGNAQVEASAAPDVVQNDQQSSQSSPDTQAETPQPEAPENGGTQPAQVDKQQSQSSPGSEPETNTGQGVPIAEAAQQTPATSPIVLPTPSSPALLVEGQTVPTDGQAITVNDQPVRQSAGLIFVGTSAYTTPELAGPSSIKPPSHLVAGELTFIPAATPTSTPQAAAASPFTLGGLAFAAESQKAPVFTGTAIAQKEAQPVVVGGKTYAPIEQQVDSVGTGQPEQTSTNHEVAGADSQPVVIAGQTYTPVSASPTLESNSGAPQVFSFGGKAVTQGGSPVTIDGTRYSLGQSAVVVGTSTIPLTSGLPIPSNIATASILAVGSHKLTALSGSQGGYEIDHSSLLPGSSGIVVSGITYSLNSASILIVGTSTVALATAAPSNEALTAAGEIFTPLGSTAVVVENQTLLVGGSLTENGRIISLGSAGFVVDSSTFHYAAPIFVSATATPVESSGPASASATGSFGLNSTMLTSSASGSLSASASPTTPSLIVSSPTGSLKGAGLRESTSSEWMIMGVLAFMSMHLWVPRI